jgi:hypothetical protein
MYRRHSRFQDNKNKECEKTQKQISELVGALNKYQSEKENTTNREINELKKITESGEISHAHGLVEPT